MDKAKMDKHRNYSRFDEMSTETLQEILRQDSYCENSDTDVILYILEVIQKRESQNPQYNPINVDEAWKSFQENYKPYSSVQSLYEESNESEDVISSERNLGKNEKKIFRRTATAVAAVFIIFIIGSVTTYALGFDLWDTIITWSKEKFSLSSSNLQKHETKTQELRTVLGERRR